MAGDKGIAMPYEINPQRLTHLMVNDRGLQADFYNLDTMILRHGVLYEQGCDFRRLLLYALILRKFGNAYGPVSAIDTLFDRHEFVDALDRILQRIYVETEPHWLTDQITAAENDSVCLETFCQLHKHGHEFFELVLHECIERAELLGTTPSPLTLDSLAEFDRPIVVGHLIGQLRCVEYADASDYHRQAVRVLIYNLSRIDFKGILGRTLEDALTNSQCAIALKEMQLHQAEDRRRRAERAESISQARRRKEERGRKRQMLELMKTQDGTDPDGLIRSLARRWFHDSERPCIEIDVLKTWIRTIDEFSSNNTYPLLLRRPGPVRGACVDHVRGRTLVFADNSPAIWLFKMATRGDLLQPNDLAKCLRDGTLPVALALQKSEAEKATFRGILKDHKNWKFQLCHYDDIGKPHLRWVNVSNADLSKLVERSRRFLSLDNMFVVRKDRHYTQGLGENLIFREELKRLERAAHRDRDGS